MKLVILVYFLCFCDIGIFIFIVFFLLTNGTGVFTDVCLRTKPPHTVNDSFEIFQAILGIILIYLFLFIMHQLTWSKATILLFYSFFFTLFPFISIFWRGLQKEKNYIDWFSWGLLWFACYSYSFYSYLVYNGTLKRKIRATIIQPQVLDRTV